MDLARGIRKHGFRKWYERELMAGHAYMVLALLALLGGLGALELYTGHPPGSKPLVNLMSMLLCAGIGWWSVRRSPWWPRCGWPGRWPAGSVPGTPPSSGHSASRCWWAG